MLILGIGGTTRENSSSEKVLSRALEAVRELGIKTAIVSGADLDLPMYAPHGGHLDLKSHRLVDLLRRCDGLVISSPSYHGSVSGMIKNALDYAEELRDDDRPYLEGRAVGCIATAYGWQGANAALAALRSIVHALRGWPTPLGAAINTSANAQDYLSAGSDADGQITLIAEQVVDFARSQSSGDRRQTKSGGHLKLAHSSN